MLQESMSTGDRLCGVESERGRGAKLQSHAACQNGVCVCEKWQWGLCLIDFLSEHFSFVYSAVTNILFLALVRTKRVEKLEICIKLSHFQNLLNAVMLYDIQYTAYLLRNNFLERNDSAEG